MKKELLTLMIITALAAPTGVLAMKEMNHDSMSEPSGMEMGGEMIMLHDQEVDEVVGSAHLMDVKAKMAEHGMSKTHHIMVAFMDDDKKQITKGQVAVKVKAPDGTVGKATKLMSMSGQFGVDITLDQTGTYQFIIGTKLADGKKRTFTFQFDN